MSLNIREKLRTASCNPKFAGSYKKSVLYTAKNFRLVKDDESVAFERKTFLFM